MNLITRWLLKPRTKQFITAARKESWDLDNEMWPSFGSSHIIPVTVDRENQIGRQNRRCQMIADALCARRIRIIKQLIGISPSH
ncbi:MAG: hypothetical protein NTY30_04425 [Candidatus Berkelbacteria bacterium]|nr:hypothetical protein [Candidatus Berkelbacteria bacterium]